MRQKSSASRALTYQYPRACFYFRGKPRCQEGTNESFLVKEVLQGIAHDTWQADSMWLLVLLISCGYFFNTASCWTEGLVSSNC